MPALGRPFDPARMRVVDVELTDRVEAGTVLEVRRAGYRRGDELLRPAEVRAARPPPGSASDPQDTTVEEGYRDQE